MTDIHGSREKVENIVENTEHQLLEKFHNYLSLNLSTTKNQNHYRHLSNLRKILEYQRQKETSIQIENLDQDDVITILTQIENSEYKKTGEYATSTQNKYRTTLGYLLNMQDKDWDDYTPKGVTKNKPRNDEELTDPEKVPNPEEIAEFLTYVESHSKNYTSLRNVAFFFTLWDTGTRANGLIPVKKDAVKVKDKTVEVEVVPVKDSPRRKIECYFAAPILKKYLENHPCPDNPYLFPNMNTEKQDNHIGYRQPYNIARNTWRKLVEDNRVDVNYQGQPLHIFRKSMKTWFKKMGILTGDEVDIRAGHKLGSSMDRIYSRLSDSDSNTALRKQLGIEDEDDKDWKKVLEPQKCRCGSLNSGHRLSCYSCGKTLKKQAYPEEVRQQTSKEDVQSELEKLQNEINRIKKQEL